MYLYFDTQGNLKEQINDQALRQGNSNINKLYVYWEKSEDNANITGLWARFKADDGTYNPSSSTWIESNTYVQQTIPYDKKRDLKFFNYFKTYKFYTITIPDAVLGQSGAWLGTLQFVETDSITTLGQLAFYVSESNSSVEADENINIAQWNYLIALVSSTINSIPTKTSDLTNDSGFITNEADDLTNYYKKTETYDQDEIDALIDTRMTFKGWNVVGALNSLVSSTTDKSTLNGWTYKIGSGGTLNNYDGTTTAEENDVVVFKYTSATNWLWIVISQYINISNYVTLTTEQEITGKKTFNYDGGIYLPEKTNTPSSSHGLQAQDDGHLYWKGTKVPLISDVPTNNNQLTNGAGYQNASQVTTAINNALTSVYKFQGSISVSDLNDYISNYTGDKNNLNGWVYNITDSGNLNNSSGTTSVVAGDNVAFYVYNIPSQLYEWDKLAGTLDTSNFVTLDGTQEITGKKTFDYAGGIYLNEKTSTPASTDGLQAQDNNHLYWKGQKIPLNSDIPTNISSLTNDSGYQNATQVQSEIANGVPYLTTAPSSNNTSGKLKFVVLSSEPSTYYDGYYYIITGSNS